MKLKFRFLALLIAALLALALGLATLGYVQHREEADSTEAVRRDRLDQLGRLLPLIETPLQQFATDYSMWDAMVTFLEKRDPEWARQELDSGLANSQVSAIWVMALDGTCFHSAIVAANGTIRKQDMPAELGEGLFDGLKANSFQSFYIRAEGELYAVRTAAIQPSSDSARSTPPRGWLVATRRLDPAYIENVARLTGATVGIDPGEAPREGPARNGHVKVLRPLRNLKGETAATLVLDYQPWLLTENANKEETFIMIAVSILLLAGTFLCLQRWVLTPFSVITGSLERADPKPLKPLLEHTTEIGHIARLIRIHFAHQRALSDTMEDRARLARDLHDGVIQSIYAAGMGVAAAQSMIATDPEEAQKQLSGIREALNETIREARGFIDGLDTSSVKGELFGTAVKALVESMRWIHPAALTCRINEAAALDLPAAAKAQALQMIREAVSNSLRHGHANSVTITLSRTGRNTALVIEDDGCGFDTSTPAGTGHGLANLAERAQSLGGTATIESSPGRGTRVSVSFTPSKPRK